MIHFSEDVCFFVVFGFLALPYIKKNAVHRAQRPNPIGNFQIIDDVVEICSFG